MVCRMNAASVIIAGAILLASPLIARELRRIVVSIATEIKTLKDEMAAIKAAPVVLPATADLTPLHDAITALTAKVDALATLVGTHDELDPPAPAA